MISRIQSLESRPTPQLLSLVVPVYNEEDVIPHLQRKLYEVSGNFPCHLEIILVNDGSSDGTLSALQRWAAEDSRVRVVSLSRNFGHQAASTAGLDCARGEAVVLMDADLQDPPDLIIQMLGRYGEGFDVVYAQRERRLGEGWFKRATAWLFYRTMRWVSKSDLPPDTGDYRLISRSCLDALIRMRETHRFLRGMVAWLGFPQTAVRFVRQPRAAGATKYHFRKQVHLAWTAAVSFSPAPLRVVFAFGFVVAGVGVLAGCYALMAKLLHYFVAPGWTSLMLTLCLIGSCILISLGVIGEYVAKIYEEVKGRPLYVIDPARSRRLDQ